MRARLRDDSGIALIAVIAILTILMGLGLAVAEFADSQQRAAAAERTHESGFNQAEAVLNAQVFQLQRAWPTATSPATWRCNPATPGAGTTATTCPDPNGVNGSFAGVDYNQSGCAAQPWETIVQDDDPAYGKTQYYDPVGMNPATHAAVPYDANGNNSVWVRATTTAHCRRQTVVALATRALTQVQWPASVLTADWFKTGNNGKKVIINTVGTQPPPPNPPHAAGNVSLRCTASGHTGSSCKQYKPGQVAPDTIPASPMGGTPVLNPTQIASLSDQAKASGNYYGGQDVGHPACPGSVPLGSVAPGTVPVIFVEGLPSGCTTSASGNTVSTPVIFVLYDGKFSLTGNSKFYGLLYAINHSNQNVPIVSLGGCAKIQGVVGVDGLGGVDVGACKQNLTYDPTVLSSVKTYGGAVVAKNSFRVLPGNAP